MIASIIRKHLICVTDVRAIGKSIPGELLYVIGIHRKHLMEAPELHKGIHARNPCVANASALYRGQNPQHQEKRVSGSKKLPFPKAPEKGDLSRKIPIFLVEPCREMGIFSLKSPFFGGLGNGSFLTPKPSFPDFGDFDPCTGPTRSQPLCNRCPV